MITYDDFSKLELVVASIKEAERVEGSEKLIRLSVNIGDEERQIVAGIGKNHDAETLIDKQIVILKNLEPRSIMGLESQGMLLAVGSKDGPILLTPEMPAEPGSDVK